MLDGIHSCSSSWRVVHGNVIAYVLSFLNLTRLVVFSSCKKCLNSFFSELCHLIMRYKCTGMSWNNFLKALIALFIDKVGYCSESTYFNNLILYRRESEIVSWASSHLSMISHCSLYWRVRFTVLSTKEPVIGVCNCRAWIVTEICARVKVNSIVIKQEEKILRLEWYLKNILSDREVRMQHQGWIEE